LTSDEYSSLKETIKDMPIEEIEEIVYSIINYIRLKTSSKNKKNTKCSSRRKRRRRKARRVVASSLGLEKEKRSQTNPKKSSFLNPRRVRSLIIWNQILKMMVSWLIKK
jgi:hypothetical protein